MRYAFYPTKDRSERQMREDLVCLASEVKNGATALAIAITREDGITEITWSGEASETLAASLEALVKDVRQAI